MSVNGLDVRNSSSFSKCATYDIPSIPDYLKATNKYGITLVCLGTGALLLVIFLFVDTLRYIIRNSSSRVKTHTAFIIAVYPVTSLVSYFAILVPRAHLLSEALTQGMFMFGMYQLFCLFVSYCGGDAELVKTVGSNRLSIKVGPCCCFPCFGLVPTFNVNKKTVKYLKLLVLQLPLVQGLVYFVLLVMWAEGDSLYQVNYMYLQPVIITSILFGVWGMLMTINLLKETLDKTFLLLGKFAALQMVLILAKLQGLVTRALVWLDILPCNSPITPQVYANLIHNTLMIIEMILLGFLTRKLYKRNLPHMGKSINISTLESVICNSNTSFGDKYVKTVNNNDATGYENIACDAC